VALVEDDDVVETSRRMVPITRSANGFCHGLRGAVRTSAIPMCSTRFWKAGPYTWSRSRGRAGHVTICKHSRMSNDPDCPGGCPIQLPLLAHSALASLPGVALLAAAPAVPRIAREVHARLSAHHERGGATRDARPLGA
jgi:hypothetical protein